MDVRRRRFGAAFLGWAESMTGAAVVTAIIIGALYFGRELFVPIALAILLSFVLAPLTRALQNWHVPRGLSVVVVVLLAFLTIFAMGGIIATQVAELAGDLPRYQLTMREKVKTLRGTAATSSTLERAADVLQDLGKELNRPKETAPTLGQPASPGQEVKPIPVEVRQPPPTALETIAALITPLLRPLTTTGIMAIFVIFILLQREDLRNRFIRLAGAHDLQKTTAALNDGASRLSRFFRPVGSQRRLWPRHWCWPVGDWGTQLSSVGHPCSGSTLCPLYRCFHFGGIPVDTGGSRRPRLVDAGVDSGALPCGGAAGRSGD